MLKKNSGDPNITLDFCTTALTTSDFSIRETIFESLYSGADCPTAI